MSDLLSCIYTVDIYVHEDRICAQNKIIRECCPMLSGRFRANVCSENLDFMR